MDSEARFEEIYRAHCGAVRSFVHRRVPAYGADDVVADVFVAAWRRLDEAPQDARFWLFGIARGLISNRRRGERRRTALHERLAARAVGAVSIDPESQATETDAVLRALASLNERDRETLRLLAWEGLDRRQAAQVLGITAASVSVRLHRARRRFARALADGEQIDTQMTREATTR